MQKLFSSKDLFINEPYKCFIWFGFEANSLFVFLYKGTNAIEGIFLNLAKIKGINLDSRAFTNMSSLRVLKFYMPEGLDMSFEEQHSDSKVQFPDGLDYLPEKLKYLHLHKYPLRTLPENFKPKNLIELNLPFSKIVQIWEGKKVCGTITKIFIF